MRRKDKEVSDAAAIEAIIAKASVCRLGMVDGDKPYVVPLNFGYRDNTLYFHGALKGRKIDILKENPNVCIEFDVVDRLLESDEACGWSMKFQSAVAFGTAMFIDDPEEKRQALAIIMNQYSDKVFEFPEKKVKATGVFKVEVENMSGKQSGF